MHIFILMLPVVLPVLLGYLLARAKIFAPSVGDSLLKYLMYATFPAVILGNLVNKKFHELFRLDFSIATTLAVLGIYGVTFFIYKLVFKAKNSQSAMAALCTSFVSAGIVGLPVMAGIIGVEISVVPVIVNTIISLVTVVPITVLLIKLEQDGAGKDLFRTLGATFVDVLKNPLVAASLIGLFLVIFEIPVPYWLHDTFQKIGEATFATALVAVGIGINPKTLKKNLGRILTLSFLRVIVFTVVGFGMAIWFHMGHATAVAFVMIMALPTAKSVPPIGQEYDVFVSESIQVVTITTLAMFVIMPPVIYVANLLWPGVVK
jgi:hypothetical protein